MRLSARYGRLTTDRWLLSIQGVRKGYEAGAGYRLFDCELI